MNDINLPSLPRVMVVNMIVYLALVLLGHRQMKDASPHPASSRFFFVTTTVQVGLVRVCAHARCTFSAAEAFNVGGQFE